MKPKTSKPKPRSASKTKPFAPPPVDRALRRAWDLALAELKSAEHQGAKAFDAKWEAIGAILDHEPPLYLAGGYSSMNAFFKEHVEEDVRTALRNVRVAKYATPEEEERYGISKLDAAIDFVEAKLGGPAKGRVPIDFAALRIPVTRDKKSFQVPLVDATVEEIRRAAGVVRRSGSATSRGKPSPVVTTITKALGLEGLTEVRVSVVKDRLTISSIPRDQFARAMKTLARVRLPA